MYLYINSNSAGMTPMTAYFSSSSRISRPMILRSPPYRICQKLWLSTTTLFAPGFSSSGENVLIRADAQRQSDDGYNCKAGLLQQHSRAEAQVLQQCLHKLSRGR